MSDVIRIHNILNYTQEIIDGVLILTPKIKTITSEFELFNNYLLNNSNILECIIKDINDVIILSIFNTKYISVLKNIGCSVE